MTMSTATWKIVYMHADPFGSGETYGSYKWVQWPFYQWGAHVVLSGGDHLYERLWTNGIPYIVNGLGGKAPRDFGQPIAGSQVRFNADYGALRINVESNVMTFDFFTRSNVLVDHYAITNMDLTSPPIIRQQPESQLVRPGSNAVFRVYVPNYGGQSYQWKKDGEALPHATKSSLVITNAQFADEGQYFVTVSNSFGAATSAPARLTILQRPTIIVHPVEQSVAEGGDAAFSVVVTGSLPLTFLWRKDGVTRTNMILNERVSFLTLRNVSSNLAGTWRVIVTNDAGAALPSNNANLVVLADSDGDGAADIWERQNGFDPMQASDGFADLDGDGLSNANEFKAGTNPNDAGSTLKMRASREPGTVRLQFVAISNHTYPVQQRELTNLRWQTSVEIPAVLSNRNVEIMSSSSNASLLYRLTTPR